MNLLPFTLSAELAQIRASVGLDAALQRNEHVRALLKNVERHGKHWAVVGGAPRQWALAVESEPTDLDIVVGMSSEMLETVMTGWLREIDGQIGVASTAFGGYRLTTDAWEADIWPVRKTVGVARGFVTDTKSFRAVARSAALSFDSIVVTSQGTFYENGFLATCRTGLLRMNHCSIERPHKVAEKAVKLCKSFRLVPDISVQALIAARLGREVLDSLFESGRTESLLKR